MIVGDREGHELLERHAILGIDPVQLGRDLREAEALVYHRRGHIEVRGDGLDILALVDYRLNASELVERMERFAEGVFRIAVLLGQYALIGRSDNTGDRCVAGTA